MDLYFASQSPNIDSQIFSIATMLCTPHTPQQCLVCKYLARMQCQLLQQTEFCRSELDAFTVVPNLSLLKINLDIPKSLRTNRARRIGPTGTPQDSLYPCQ